VVSSTADDSNCNWKSADANLGLATPLNSKVKIRLTFQQILGPMLWFLKYYSTNIGGYCSKYLISFCIIWIITLIFPPKVGGNRRDSDHNIDPSFVLHMCFFSCCTPHIPIRDSYITSCNLQLHFSALGRWDWGYLDTSITSVAT
jgi:hypothetical protein